MNVKFNAYHFIPGLNFFLKIARSNDVSTADKSDLDKKKIQAINF